MQFRQAWLETARDGDLVILTVGGRWDIGAVSEIDSTLRDLDVGSARAARFELSEIQSLDTAGAWALHRTRCDLREKGIETEFFGATEPQASLFERLERCPEPESMEPPRSNLVLAILARLGKGTFDIVAESRDMLAFFGLVVVTGIRTAARPTRLRFTSVVAHAERIGINALPIVGLLSFLIGIVLAYQGADQLRRFGAEVFTVNLLGISIVREIGVLLTAILIAGRSGSAFAAQIGTMKVNQEVDAMNTLGLDPIELLVIPRLLALTLVLPLLAFYADVMGLFGGAVMAMAVLDMSPLQFVTQLNGAIPIWSFWIGIIKAPVFGAIIAITGCYNGLQVTGSADSVGRMTTQSVVEAIFLVIVFDAVFSILFSRLGL